MATRTIANGGGNWNAAGTWAENSVPTAADDVVATGTSGNLTVTQAAVCRSLDLTGYVGTFTINTNYGVTIGTTTSKDNNVALILAGTVSMPTNTSSIAFSSSSASTLTIDFGNATIGALTFTAGIYNITSNLIFLNSSTPLTFTAGTITFSGSTITNGQLSLSSTGVRLINFNSIIWTSSSTNIISNTGSNITISSNTAQIVCTAASTTIATNGLDLNGLSFIISGAAGTCTFTGNLYVKDLIIISSSTKTISLGTITVYVSGNITCYSTNGVTTISGTSAGSLATINKTNGTVHFYNAILSYLTLTGGATFNGSYNITPTSVTGLNIIEAQYCVDLVNGNNNNLGIGWWSVAYTDASGTLPIQGELCTGATNAQTANIMGIINDYEWNTLKAGTLYFYGKSGTFTAEQVNLGTGGGHFHIVGDLSVNACLTVGGGLTTARIAPGTLITVSKTAIPTSLCNATWTSVSLLGGALPTAQNIASSTSGTPIVVTKTAHGFINGDIVQIIGHTTNTNANGAWRVINKTDNTFELEGSVGNGTGGATGTVQNINPKAVVLDTAQTLDIERCETAAWTANGTGDMVGTVVQTPVSTDAKEGGYCMKFTLDAAVQTSKMQAYKAISIAKEVAVNYQKISFWIKNEVAIAADNYNITLCSGADGTGVLDTFAIPAIPCYGKWICLTLAKTSGTNLGNEGATNIASIALNTGSVAPTASKYIYLDNIIACTTNGLSLQSLISKNTLEVSTEVGTNYGNEPWFGIQSINGRVVLLDNDSGSCKSNAGRGYFGATENVPTYIREGAKGIILNAYDVTAGAAIQESGTLANPIRCIGGYSSSTNSRTGITIYDMCGSNGGLYSAKNYTIFSYISAVKSNTPLTLSGTFPIVEYITDLNNFNALTLSVNTIITTLINCCNGNGLNFNHAGLGSITTLIHCNSHTSSGITISGIDKTILYITEACNNATNGVYYYNATNAIVDTISNVSYNSTSNINMTSYLGNSIRLVTVCSYSTTGMWIYGYQKIGYINISYCTTGVYSASAIGFPWIGTLITSNNTTPVYIACSMYVVNMTMNEAFNIVSPIANSNLYVNKYNGNYARIFTDSGTIIAQSAIAGGSGTEWKMVATSLTRTINYPLSLSLAKFAVVANKLVTLSVYLKKASLHANVRLYCRWGQVTWSDAATDRILLAVNDLVRNNTSITFTPTEAGVVEVEVQLYYLSTATLIAPTAYADSSNHAGINTKITLTAHTIQDGDTVTIIGTTAGQYDGQYVAEHCVTDYIEIVKAFGTNPATKGGVYPCAVTIDDITITQAN